VKQVLLAGISVLAFATFTGCATSADEHETTSEQSSDLQSNLGCSQETQLGTVYYADASFTTIVGTCTISCQQFAVGDDPFFGDGGTCTGTSSSFQVGLIGTCNVCRF
jgi:hypothetical protein